jgi:HAD superfamily hydrolase (TIGR01549 family)
MREALVMDSLKALIFDLDGTLYHQGPVRRAVLMRILRDHAARPIEGIRTLVALRVFRQAQEQLRSGTQSASDLSRLQIDWAARRSGMGKERIQRSLARWMVQEPLPFLAASRRSGTVELLQLAQDCGLQLGVLSDYPAEQKLISLGIRKYFDVVVAAQDREVQRFKPDPAGLLVALSRLRVCASDVLYIGDRADVDGLAASRAGVRSIILNRRENFDRVAALLPAHQVVHS